MLSPVEVMRGNGYLKKGIATAKQGLEALNSLDNIKEQEKEFKIINNV